MDFTEKYPFRINHKGIILIVSLFLVAFRLPGNNEFQGDLKKSILDRKLCIAETYNLPDLKNSTQYSVIRIPSDAVFKYLSRRISDYKYRVVRVKFNSDDVSLKSMRVNLIKEDSGYMVVSGLNPGDSLLVAPQESLKELVKTHKLELRDAFSNI